MCSTNEPKRRRGTSATGNDGWANSRPSRIRSTLPSRRRPRNASGADGPGPLRSVEEGLQDLLRGQRRGEFAGQDLLLQLGGGGADGGVGSELMLECVADELPGPAHLLGPPALVELPGGLHPVLVLDQLG